MLFYFLQKVRSNSTQNIVTLTQRKITCFSEKKRFKKYEFFSPVKKHRHNLLCSLFALFRETKNSNTCAANLLRNSTVYTILYKSYVKFQYSPSCLLEVRVNKARKCQRYGKSHYKACTKILRTIFMSTKTFSFFKNTIIYLCTDEISLHLHKNTLQDIYC